MTDYFDSKAASWDLDPMKVERARATAEQVKHTMFYSQKSLVDIGGATGLLAVLLKDEFEEILIADMSESMLEVSSEKIRQAGITNIKTQKIDQDISELSGSYSAIVTLMTLHHIEHVGDFIKQVSEKLEDDGVFMIADLHLEDGSFHSHHDGFDGHNGFNTEELSRHLHLHGLEVIRVKDYFEISKKSESGKMQHYPLFFLAARKIQL